MCFYDIKVIYDILVSFKFGLCLVILKIYIKIWLLLKINSCTDKMLHYYSERMLKLKWKGKAKVTIKAFLKSVCIITTACVWNSE